MKMMTVTSVFIGVLAAAALGSSATAAADPLNGNAADVIKMLKSRATTCNSTCHRICLCRGALLTVSMVCL